MVAISMEGKRFECCGHGSVAYEMSKRVQRLAMGHKSTSRLFVLLCDVVRVVVKLTTTRLPKFVALLSLIVASPAGTLSVLSAAPVEPDWSLLGAHLEGEQTLTVLHLAAAEMRSQSRDKDLTHYSRAIPILSRLLIGLEPSRVSSRKARLNTGRAWRFLGEMSCAVSQFDPACLKAELNALALLEAAKGSNDLEIALALLGSARARIGAGESDLAVQLCQRSLEMRKNMLGRRHLLVADALAALAEAYFEASEFRPAIASAKRSLAIREHALGDNDPAVADVLDTLAAAYDEMSLFDLARSLHDRSLSIKKRRHGDDHPSLAITFSNFANHHYETASYEQSLLFYQKSLSITESYRGQEYFDFVVTLNNIGRTYARMGDYVTALSSYQRSVSIARALPSTTRIKSSIPIMLTNIGVVYRALGRHPEELSYYQEGLAVLEAVYAHDHPDIAIPLNAIASFHEAMGQYVQALPYSKRALAIREKAYGKRHTSVAVSLGNLAGIYRYLGDYSEAVSLYSRARSIDEEMQGQWHPDVGSDSNNLGGVHELMGDYEKAVECYERSVAIFRRSSDAGRLLLALALGNLANVLHTMGKYGRSEELYQESLVIRRALLDPYHVSIGGALNNLGALYIEIGRYKEAMPMLYQAEQIGVLGSVPELTWRPQNRLREIYASQGMPELSIFWGKRAVDTIQSMRADLSGLAGSTHQSFLRDKQHVYRGLVVLLAEQRRLPEALHVLALLKEQEQLEYRSTDSERDPSRMSMVYSSLEQSWVAKYASAARRQRELDDEFQKLSGIDQKSKTPEQVRQLAGLESALAAVRLSYQQLAGEITTELGAPASGQASFAEADIEKLVDLQQQTAELGAGSIVIHYLVTSDRLHIFLTTPAGVIHRSSDITEKALNRLLGEYRQTLRNPTLNPEVQAHALYRLLLEPIAPDLDAAGAKVLMVSLDGALRYLPMAALHDGKRWLAEKYAVTVYTAVTRAKLRDHPQATWRIAGFGVTKGTADLDALPKVRQELQNIIRESTADESGVMDGELLLDEQVTEESLAALIQRRAYPVIHLASHFRFSPTGTLAESYLLLGNGKHLTLEQFSGERFSLRGVDLLTLSACETALEGTTSDGREIEGFGTLAQVQGAQAVLATQWSVADDSTAVFMETFYSQRQQRRLTKAEALRQAQLAFIRGDVSSAQLAGTARGAERADGEAAAKSVEYTPDMAKPYAHPFYWAPFILMGNWQ